MERNVSNIYENGYACSICTRIGGWYAQMPDEKKLEYLNNLSISWQQKKTATTVFVDVNERPPSS
jgi:hypothetical protein